MSIYRSGTGRERLHECYDRALDGLDVPIDERTIATRHGDTHVLLAGPADAPPVYCFHGGNATNPMTLAWYTDLAEDYRLIAPDTIGQPGYSAETRVNPVGDGYGEWVVDLLDAFDCESAPMIGTSYGAGIVLRTAALTPERIDRTALVVPAGFGTGSIGSLARVGVPALLYRYLHRQWALDRMLDAMCTSLAPDPMVRETIAASLRYVDLEREFPTATAEELQAFDAPTRVYLGTEDPFFPADPIDAQVRDRLSNVEVETLDEEKHILSDAAQERVTGRIGAFLGD
ncbi:hypothetical protein GCM10028857_21230 [Salinarchaeum chitinilyticum]